MRVIRDPDIIAGYLRDASNTTGFAEALVRPRSAEEVAEVVARCQDRAVPLTVTARRTSTTGASVPRGGWLLSTEHLDTIHSPEEADAGVILARYQETVARTGRWYPPDPTSRAACSLGASIACNASGARSFRYGPTRPWVEAVDVVLPTGEIVHADRDTPLPAGWPAPRWTPPSVKTAAGYAPADSLLDVMIGAEGTLGVITRARLRHVPAPVGVLALLVFFGDVSDCLGFVERARRGAPRPGRPGIPGGLAPLSLEFADRRTLSLISPRIPDLPAGADCALMIEVDGDPPLERWWSALDAAGALDVVAATDAAGRARLKALRHAIPAAVNERIAGNGMPKVGTDFAVPDSALGEMMEAYAAVELPCVLFGHIGDSHLHLNLLPRDGAGLVAARACANRLARRALALGGTVSAEHGIGKLKRDLLALQVGSEVLAGFAALKAAADPNHVLGRGNILTPPDDLTRDV